MKKGIVDRFEGHYALIEMEDENVVDVHLEIVRSDVKVGDVVEYIDGLWITNKLETEKRRQHIQELEDELFED